MSREALIGFVVAMVLSGGLILALSPVARRVGLLDHPGGRKDHAKPTPVIGGLAIALAACVPALWLGEVSAPYVGLALAVTLLVAVGLLDDIHDIRWMYRLAAQTAAALLIVYVGGVRVEQVGPVFGFSGGSLGALSMPFTVLATVGLINALNMIDGVDGLAGLQGLCALLMLWAGATYSGNDSLANFAMVVAGAMVGFLAFNLRTPWLPRAKVFLGNSGSAVLGLVIAWVSFRMTQNPMHPVTPVLAPFLIALPVIDCLALLLHRSREHGKPFAADRNHLHHLLIDAGFRPTEVALGLAGLSLCIGLTAALARLAQLQPPFYILVYGLLLAGYAGLTHRRGRAISVFRWLHRTLGLGARNQPAGRANAVESPPQTVAPEPRSFAEDAPAGVAHASTDAARPAPSEGQEERSSERLGV
jgi:UDP-GlcNAc:undecaprenyl-phosphate GlcNAc-1-phosphate transferase